MGNKSTKPQSDQAVSDDTGQLKDGAAAGGRKSDEKGGRAAEKKDATLSRQDNSLAKSDDMIQQKNGRTVGQRMLDKDAARAPAESEKPDSVMSQFLQTWFPNLDTESYIIPPIHYGTQHGKDMMLGNQEVKVLKSEEYVNRQSNHANRNARKDIALESVQKRLHSCLTKVMRGEAGKGRVMLILMQSKCSMYRGVMSGVAETNNNNIKEATYVTQNLYGISDLLVLDRDYGILLGAITVDTGSNPELLRRRLSEAVSYLNRATTFLTDSVLPNVDGGSDVEIHKTILLPNLSKTRLNEEIQRMEGGKLLSELQQCLGVGSQQDLDQICLCEDYMKDETGQKLDAWWKFSFQKSNPNPALHSKIVYRQLVERFFPPVTTTAIKGSSQPRLQLWTHGQAVNEVAKEFGRKMTKLALFPQQFQILHDTPDDEEDDFTYLCGGPGTGKTAMLVLKGVEWLSESKSPVVVLRTEENGLSAAYLIQHQLKKTAELKNRDRVPLLDYHNDKDGKATAQKLLRYANTNDILYILADESNSVAVSRLYKELKQQGVGTVRLWAAGVFNPGIPTDLQHTVKVKVLEEPLRSPPSVVREVARAEAFRNGQVPSYVSRVVPFTDGPPIIHLQHYRASSKRKGSNSSHRSYAPWRCEDCGSQLADTLIDTLHVGDASRQSVRYRDVVVLGDIDCDLPEDDGKSPTPLITYLKSRGIPTLGVGNKDPDAIRQLALNKGPDMVTVTQEKNLWGLERKVVVYFDFHDDADVYGRLRSMSRSTAQVIWIQDV